MCGVWIALEPVNEENGGLHYYPGSHRLPVLECHDAGISGFDGGGSYTKYEDAIENLIAVAGLSKRVVSLEPGDALIWAANLLHGGNPILREGATRFSQVTHYYFEGCRFYTPLHSDIASGEIALRESIVNIATRKKIDQTELYRGFSLFKSFGKWMDRRVSLAKRRIMGKKNQQQDNRSTQ